MGTVAFQDGEPYDLPFGQIAEATAVDDNVQLTFSAPTLRPQQALQFRSKRLLFMCA